MKELKLACGAVTLVDDEDYEGLSQFSWRRVRGYAVSSVGERVILRLHRAILQAPEGLEVDHVNGNTLDNRKENLRLCTRQQNMCNQRVSKANTSGRKGVSWRKDLASWAAYITVHGKRVHLGFFLDRDDAAKAYDVASRKLHGEFGLQNGLDVTLGYSGRRRGPRRKSADSKSGLLGVFPGRRGRWKAICQEKHLGTFPTKVAAAIAYNLAALHAFGFDAYQNPVFSGEEL